MPLPVAALRSLCEARPDIAELVKHSTEKKTGIAKAALLYCFAPNDHFPIFQALGDFISMSDIERNQEPIDQLSRIELDWAGRDVFFVQLLKLRNVKLARALFGGACPPTILNIGKLDIGRIDWWLEWMQEAKIQTDGDWIVSQLWGIFGAHLCKEKHDEFLAEFNKPESKFRSLLQNFVFPFFSDLTSDSLNEDAISFLLADLNQVKSRSSFRGHLLGNMATEQFYYQTYFAAFAKSPSSY